MPTSRIVEKSNPNINSISVIKKLTKVCNRPIGENSPNLVNLICITYCHIVEGHAIARYIEICK
jgi:hypothetical protein